MKTLKARTWYVVRVNCDCCSYSWARLRPPQGNGYWMRCRCRFCRRQFGDMDYRLLGKFKVVSERDAIRLAEAERT